jgi:hypothetical protein
MTRLDNDLISRKALLEEVKQWLEDKDDNSSIYDVITNAPTIEADSGEKQRADSWVDAVRDLARELGIADEDSNGSIYDWKHIKRIALKNEADSGEVVAWKYTTNKAHTWITEVKPPDDAYDEGSLIPLYTSPPKSEWRELTDERIQEIAFTRRSILKSEMVETINMISNELKEVNHG